MGLLTEEIKSSLPNIVGLVCPIKYTYLKLVSPWDEYIWYITAYDGGDNLYGLTVTSLEDPFGLKFGFISLEDIESVKGFNGSKVEIDSTFTPILTASIIEVLISNGHI